MAPDQNPVRALYRKLLSFYPHEFREQLRESMEQTFNDLYEERKHQGARGWFGFVLWVFVETLIGIFKERILWIKEGNSMKNTLTNLRSPMLISFLLVLPFMAMEIINRRSFNEGFPIPLFVIMWLLPILFILTVMPIVRNVRAGNSLLASPVNLLFRIVVLVFITWMWAGILVDQTSCFLGVPNCD